MQYIDNVLFLLLLIAGFGLFFKSLKEIYRNIKTRKEKLIILDHPFGRWKVMAKVALRQNKMKKRPITAILHLFCLCGFVIINIELIEILLMEFWNAPFSSLHFGDTLYEFSLGL